MSKESPSHGPCAPAPLVKNRVGAVTACPGCGHVHLVLEYLTLRFEPEAFRELTRLLVSAQQCLDQQGAPEEASAVDRSTPVQVVVH